MLKISLKQGQYVNIGDNIRVVYVGGTGNHGRLMKRYLLSGTCDLKRSAGRDQEDFME